MRWDVSPPALDRPSLIPQLADSSFPGNRGNMPPSVGVNALRDAGRQKVPPT